MSTLTRVPPAQRVVAAIAWAVLAVGVTKFLATASLEGLDRAPVAVLARSRPAVRRRRAVAERPSAGGNGGGVRHRRPAGDRSLVGLLAADRGRRAAVSDPGRAQCGDAAGTVAGSRGIGCEDTAVVTGRAAAFRAAAVAVSGAGVLAAWVILALQ